MQRQSACKEGGLTLVSEMRTLREEDLGGPNTRFCQFQLCHQHPSWARALTSILGRHRVGKETLDSRVN